MKLLTAILLCAALTSCVLSPRNHDGIDAPATVAIVPLKAARPVLGLVLGAGGARGFAHVGVLKALEGAGIEADVLVGASSGALVASLHAGGLRALDLEALALALEDRDIFDFTLFGPGTVEGERLANYVNRSLKGRAIEKLDKPFAAVAARQASGEMAVFNRGNAGVAVRASASVPKYFWPVVIRGEAYVDGGMASRVPAALARQMGADVVVAVDISRQPAADAQAADVVIRPQAVRSRINDFQHRKANIDAGEAAGLAAVGAIQARLQEAARAKSGAAYGSSTAR